MDFVNREYFKLLAIKYEKTAVNIGYSGLGKDVIQVGLPEHSVLREILANVTKKYGGNWR